LSWHLYKTIKMNNLIISRCIKKPGLITGARTYRLVLNENGLYIIELGNAMMETPKTNVVSDAIAGVIVDKIAENLERKIVEKENSLVGKDLNQLVDNKKNFLIHKEGITEILLIDSNFELKLSIKSSVLKISLYFYLKDKSILETIYNQLKK